MSYTFYFGEVYAENNNQSIINAIEKELNKSMIWGTQKENPDSYYHFKTVPPTQVATSVDIEKEVFNAVKANNLVNLMQVSSKEIYITYRIETKVVPSSDEAYEKVYKAMKSTSPADRAGKIYIQTAERGYYAETREEALEFAKKEFERLKKVVYVMYDPNYLVRTYLHGYEVATPLSRSEKPKVKVKFGCTLKLI